MTNDQDRDQRRDGVKIERDHPQTRKGESDARGSAEWNENVVDPDDAADRQQQDADAGKAEPSRGSGNADELSDEERDAISSHARGGRTIGDSVGSGAGTGGDKGELGGGGQGRASTLAQPRPRAAAGDRARAEVTPARR